MRIRVDKRTPAPKMLNINGFPIGDSYKYLGVTITSSLDFGKETSLLKQKTSKLLRSLYFNQLDPAHKYDVWKTLVES